MKNKKLESLEKDITAIEEAIYSLNHSIRDMEKSLPKLKKQKSTASEELEQLINKLRSEENELHHVRPDGEAILESLEFIRSFINSLAGYTESVKRLQKNLSHLNGYLEGFKKVFVERHTKQTITMEKYRILAQLGEMDSKVLTLLMNGVKFENPFLDEMSTLRKAILSGEDIEVNDLQKRFNRLYREFADIFEDSSRQLARYHKDAKKIVQNLRDVVWM